MVTMVMRGERFQSDPDHYAVCEEEMDCAALRLIAVWAKKGQISYIDKMGSHQNGWW